MFLQSRSRVNKGHKSGNLWLNSKALKTFQAKNCCFCKILTLKMSIKKNGRALMISGEGFSNTELVSFTCNHCRHAYQA